MIALTSGFEVEFEINTEVGNKRPTGRNRSPKVRVNVVYDARPDVANAIRNATDIATTYGRRAERSNSLSVGLTGFPLSR